MAITTCFDTDYAKFWDRDIDPEMRNLLDHLNRVSGERWAVLPMTSHTGHWPWRKPSIVYTLHLWLHETLFGDEWQVLEFSPTAAEGGRQTAVPREVIMAYLHGYLAGICAPPVDHEEAHP